MASPPPPTKASRPLTLKLKTGSHSSLTSNALPGLHTSSITTAPLVATPGAMSPPPATPLGSKKIILKRSQPPTPAAVPEGVPILPATAASRPPATPATPTVTMTQKGRVSKPTAKKRARDFDESEDEMSSKRSGPPKRPKLILKKSLKPKTASIVLKQVHKEAPPHSRGEGYDSEEDDREPDPMIEEEFVLRMLPGEHCDYLNKMVEERKIGIPVKDGGADFHLRWLPGAERRALVTVIGTHYVGVLVDLPTITEGMKTWDKRNFMKSADICQMLLVFAKVADDVEAKSIALPGMVTKDFRWPHGLTPPMHDCIHRRFRKRLSKKEIKDKEAELQRLLNEDRIAVETKWELFDDSRPTVGDGTQNGEDEYEEDAEMMEDGEEDAYGEVDEDYFGQQGGQQQGEEQADAPDIDDAELEAMFMEEDVEGEEGAGGAGAASGATGTGAAGAGAVATPATQTGANTPAASGKPETPAAESEVSDADDDDDDDDDMDEDELAQAEQVKGVREDINDLKKQLEALDKNLKTTGNPLLKKRIEENKKRVMSELRLKQASIGEVDEEE